MCMYSKGIDTCSAQKGIFLGYFSALLVFVCLLRELHQWSFNNLEYLSDSAALGSVREKNGSLETLTYGFVKGP